ncbi:MAG: ATP-binding protein, partial [Pseudomonadota bacterium]
MTDTSKLATSLLPEEIKKSWFQSLLGSTLGLAIMLLLTLVLYIGLLATLSASVEDLDGFQQELGRWFWPVLLAPFGVIAICVGLPAALKARRERLLRRVKITAGQRTTGAFRTTPYSQADAASFHRRDGADAQAVTWVDKSTQPLLYLTGASGTGKSSLLQVALLPQLSELGWHTVLLRFDRDPEARLSAALVEEAGLWKSAPEETDLVQLLGSAEAQAKRKKRRVLIVIDQFEEFLILNDDDTMRPVLAAFKALAKEGAQALRLLFVYRDDYGPLIFKRGLPPSVAGQNEFVLAPFLRPEAEAFLKTGGRELSETAYDQLFRGLDRIEGSKGLYKLITLNMVGLVIERMGPRLDVDPERLIDGYLREKLTENDTRDHAVDVVSAMITDAGTKRPRTVGELAQDTKRADWQVRATLEKLRAAGLVRDVSGETWEIAHDFLARQIGTLLGRLKPSFFTRAMRAGPAVAVVALVVWAGLAGYLALD